MYRSNNSFEKPPEWLHSKWQEIANILAEILCVPAALIMKTQNEEMEVFISSNSANNPYHVGDKEEWHGLYCETVIKKQHKLLIPDATKDKDWDKNPDIKLGMIAYLGLPINLPDNTPFGTICVLDNKENIFSDQAEKLLHQFKKVIELDLALIQSFKLETSELSSEIVAQKAVLTTQHKELRKAKEEAEESNRLKTAFLANMSHEIRTPMNAILGFSNLLRRGDLSDEQKEKYLDQIEIVGKRLLNIISDIVDISKLDANQLEINNTEFFLNDLIDGLRNQFNIHKDNRIGDINVFKGLSDHESKIVTDENRLAQVISNLLENALKFTYQGNVEFGYKIADDFIQFFVKDSGIGIDPKDHKVIFERFIQNETDFAKSGSGTGLGLPIAKELIQLMNGEIWLESEKQKGSTFFFKIPFQVPNRAKAEKLNLESTPDKITSATILIAEDEYVNYLFLSSLLEKYPYKILHANNGQEVIEMARDIGSIDLILMDIKMPEVSGIEATQVIRKLNATIPIIALTAFALSDDKQKVLKLGFNDYLSKPVNEHRLIKTIEEHIQKS